MIEAKNIAKFYGSHAAVQNLSLTVNPGEVVGLLGLNGAGKTTTLRILSGLLLPTSGSVQLGGIDLATEPVRARSQIGFLPETPPLYGHMPVRAFLTFVARIKGVRGDVAAHVDSALAATDLLDVQHARIETLSHGYHRRIGIAQTVVHRPAVILLDEPTGGLDPVQVVHMRRLIRGLRGRNTILVSSHLLTEIHALCDRIIVLDEGRVAAEGTEAELAAGVAGQTHVRIEVRGTPVLLSETLAGLPWVLEVVALPAQDGEAAARVTLTHDGREELAQSLVAAGLGLRTIQRVHMGLESIFLRLMGRDAEGDALAHEENQP